MKEYSAIGQINYSAGGMQIFETGRKVFKAGCHKNVKNRERLKDVPD